MNRYSYCIAHRFFTFLDEWGFYAVLLLLLSLHIEAGWPIWPFTVAVIWGGICIIVSYMRQWGIEAELIYNSSEE